MKIGFFGAGKMAEGILSAIENKRGVVMAEKVEARAKDAHMEESVQGCRQHGQLLFVCG